MEDQQASQPISIESDSSTTIIVNMPEITTVCGSACGTGSGSGSGSVSVASVAATEERTNDSGVHLLVLLSLDRKPRRVTFSEGVIDNEFLNRRKSKCCCIYRKPHVFGESSSSSDDECEHCCGHPEVRLRNRLRKKHQQQEQQQQQQNEPESKVRKCHCRCHGQQAAPTQEESEKDTEITGDSDSLMTKTEL
ncbi:E3 ubiquitin-protein ligase PPP1R11 [Drosophila grimshawi]|nr:E3 ubiquitin-protein ligase PPP1R11 [Drosophila grimshawi]